VETAYDEVGRCMGIGVMLINPIVILLFALASTIIYPARALEKPGLVQSVAIGELMTPGPLGDEALGNPNAPLTVIEYSSMTCPHCAEFHLNTFPEVKKRYIDTGKVRFIFREFPLDSLAVAAAVLARCAGSGSYFRLIDMLFARQQEWMVLQPVPPLFAIANQAGFTKQSFDECLANKQIIAGVEDSRARAESRFNVNATPTFFVNGMLFRGAVGIEEIEKELQQLPSVRR
jgi:protein-disulfide isomerase